MSEQKSLAETGYPHQAGMVVAIPLTGRPLPPAIMLAFAQLMPPMNFNLRYLQSRGMPIDRARTWFAEQAVELNAKWLFFMDEDVLVPSYAIRQLIHRLEHNPEAAVAAGIYCQKAPNPEPMVFRGKGTGPYWKWRIGELFECDSIGLGCSMIRVEALKDVEKPWFKTIDDNDFMLDGINRLEAWTEDIWFCDRVRKAGWKILADGAVVPDHLDIVTGKPYNLPDDCYPRMQVAIRKGTKKILDIGSGNFPLKTDEGEVVTADIREEANPDYRCDVRRLPFDKAQFDIVYSSHTLEHFGRNEIDAVLDEWIRVLKPKGELRLVIPNIAWAADQILKGTVDNDVLNVLYGQQEYSTNFHKMGFTPDTLGEKLKARGFNDIEVSLNGYNIGIRATRKPPKKKK